MKITADNICSSTRFELLNCEIMQNDKNDQHYHKDTYLVSSDTINYYSKYKKSERPEVVANKFPEIQHTFQKKCIVLVEKTYKEAVTESCH